VLEAIRRQVPSVASPEPQGTTAALRARLPRFLDRRRAALLPAWCDWVDEILAPPSPRTVFVHGDLHGFNQVWERRAWRLRLVADFEMAGPGDPEYDFRYFPQLRLAEAIRERYESGGGATIDMRRVLAWYIRTALGDALWRSEAGIALPAGNTPSSYVDGIQRRLRLSGVYP
jgi:aminoglycoside phosphotransferase (APT) family kinase protein